MIDVIQIDPAEREIAQLFNRRGAFDMSEHGRLRFKRKRNETAEAAGFILQFAQLAQVIDALFECFDVTVEHRAGAASAHAMPGPVNIEPFLSGLFATADLVAHFRGDSLARVGWSEALAARLREEESHLSKLKADRTAATKADPTRLVPHPAAIADYLKNLWGLLETDPVFTSVLTVDPDAMFADPNMTAATDEP